MSWYITYYLASRDKETKKIYPLGPFDNNGKYYDVLCLSRVSHLYDEYKYNTEEVKFDELSDELIKALDPEGEYLTKEKYEERHSMPYEILYYKDLGSSDYIKKGYVLIKDLENSEKDDYFDEFYDVLSPEIYAKKLENELKFGPPKPQKDCEGYDITPHSVSEYTYHCWPDYDSYEYEISCIKKFMGIFLDYPGLPDNLEPVLLISQG